MTDADHVALEGARRRTGVSLALMAVVAAALFVPTAAKAQLVCGAAHTAPTIAGSVGQLVEQPGQGWAQLTFYHQNTADQFGTGGGTEPLPIGGRAVITSGFLTGAVGIIRGLDVWAQAAIHNFRIDGGSGTAQTTGLGDVRAHLRMSPALFGVERSPFSLRAGAKVPGSDFPVRPDDVPLTDGQVDWEVAVQFGQGLGSLPLYVMGWAGYRWRQEDVDRQRKPGNERFGYLGIGGPLRGLSWSLVVDGLFGTTPHAGGIPLETSRRRLVQVVPGLGLGIGPGQLHVGSQIPVSGRNLPAGPGFTVGYVQRFGGI